MKVSILTIGDEILIGQIVDTNSSWMGEQLNRIGAQVHQIITVGDEHQDIITGLNSALKEADAVLITGGLGPTKDDATKKALVDFFEVGWRFDEPTWERIQSMFSKWGRAPLPAHKEQCRMPENAELLHNKMGTAPGMLFKYQNKLIVSMPGVPYEMKYLMEYEVIPKLCETFQLSPIAHRTILTAGMGESMIAKRLEEYENKAPKNLKIAYLPNLGRVRIRLTARGENQEEIESLLDQEMLQVVPLLSDIMYGEGHITQAEALGQLLQQKDLTLACAESCTGGNIAHHITLIPGSSKHFVGGVVAYSNTIKESVLGVKTQTLIDHGAVSESTVREMVAGALTTFKSDIAIAISGVAGPGGGSEEKPVGTIWMAVGNKDHIHTQLIKAGKDRQRNIEYATNWAFEITRRFINKEYYNPKQLYQIKS